jgi:hypothetical protein
MSHPGDEIDEKKRIRGLLTKYRIDCSDITVMPYLTLLAKPEEDTTTMFDYLIDPMKTGNYRIHKMSWSGNLF